jgi:putative membrane protein
MFFSARRRTAAPELYPPLQKNIQGKTAMTRQILIIGAAFAALSLAACGEKTETKGAATPTEQAMTPDANPSATVPTLADETRADVFAMKAADLNMFEVEAAKLAATRSTNAEVKAFAKTMDAAHTKTGESLQAAITASGVAISLPMALSKDMQDDLDDLTKASNEDFDKKYADSQVDAHQAMLNLLQRYAQDGDTAAIKAFAAATAPTIQEHLNTAEGLKKGFVN